MRRSAAPSQMHSAKRPKFTVPYKATCSTSTTVQPLQAEVLSQHTDFVPSSAAPEITSTDGVSHTSAIASPSSRQLTHIGCRTFSPPMFLNKKYVNPSSSSSKEGVSQHKGLVSPMHQYSKSDHEITNDVSPQRPSSSEPESASDYKMASERLPPESHSGDINTKDKHQLSALTSIGDFSSTDNNHVDAKDMSNQKPFSSNRSRTFQVPSQSQSTRLCSQPAIHSMNQPTSHASKAIDGQAGSHKIVDSENKAKNKYLSVVWCKLSKKKHKKWEGDAVLVTQGRCVTLYDMDGKEIGKGSGYKSSELESLADDETLRVGGKEIQVMSKLSEEQFKTGTCFTGAGSATNLDSFNKSKSEAFKSFTNPVLAQNSEKNQIQTASVSKTQKVAPRFDPSAPDALVMQRPSMAHERQYNKLHSAVVDIVVDPHLCNHLRPHQRDGVMFLYECVTGMRNYGGTGAILADDMGLGKTLQCISLIWTLLKQGMYGGKPTVKRVLIITPGSLVKNWSAEFRKWLGLERLQVFAVTADSKVEDYMKTAVYPVLIISYEMFVRSYEVINKMHFDLMVCDEGHRLKNSAIKTRSLINSMDTCRRIVMSGTPIQNDLQEFFAVVDFCNPGILGSSAAFRRVYEDPVLASRQPGATKEVVELGEERAAELSRLTRKFVLRRTQEINNKYLPPKVELVLFCRPSPLQTMVYQEILRSSVVRSCLMRKGFGSGLGAGAPHLLAIAALKQVCNHPKLIAAKVLKLSQSSTEKENANSTNEMDGLFTRLVDTYQEQMASQSLHPEDSGKLAALSVILTNIFASCREDKVVLVSNHTKTLDLLQQFCCDRGYKYLRLDGHTAVAQRQQLVARFNSTYCQENIFLLSSKAGGVGLNLVGASHLFLYDIDWNPANDLQAMARVWRDGQRKEVYIYRLLTAGTLEEKVYQRQISKQGLSGAVIDMTVSHFQFSQEDLKDLFTFSKDTECDTHDLLGCQCDGEGDKEDESSPTSAAVRACQLDANIPTKQVRNLSMAELLDWKHLRGSSLHIQKSWHLKDTEDVVSYLFWHKTNANTKDH